MDKIIELIKQAKVEAYEAVRPEYHKHNDVLFSESELIELMKKVWLKSRIERFMTAQTFTDKIK